MSRIKTTRVCSIDVKGREFCATGKMREFFFHLREKMSGISAREGEKLPEKIPVGKFLPGNFFPE